MILDAAKDPGNRIGGDDLTDEAHVILGIHLHPQLALVVGVYGLAEGNLPAFFPVHAVCHINNSKSVTNRNKFTVFVGSLPLVVQGIQSVVIRTTEFDAEVQLQIVIFQVRSLHGQAGRKGNTGPLPVHLMPQGIALCASHIACPVAQTVEGQLAVEPDAVIVQGVVVIHTLLKLHMDPVDLTLGDILLDDLAAGDTGLPGGIAADGLSGVHVPAVGQVGGAVCHLQPEGHLRAGDAGISHTSSTHVQELDREGEPVGRCAVGIGLIHIPLGGGGGVRVGLVHIQQDLLGGLFRQIGDGQGIAHLVSDGEVFELRNMDQFAGRKHGIVDLQLLEGHLVSVHALDLELDGAAALGDAQDCAGIVLVIHRDVLAEDQPEGIGIALCDGFAGLTVLGAGAGEDAGVAAGIGEPAVRHTCIGGGAAAGHIHLLQLRCHAVKDIAAAGESHAGKFPHGAAVEVGEISIRVQLHGIQGIALVIPEDQIGLFIQTAVRAGNTGDLKMLPGLFHLELKDQLVLRHVVEGGGDLEAAGAVRLVQVFRVQIDLDTGKVMGLVIGKAEACRDVHFQHQIGRILGQGTHSVYAAAVGIGQPDIADPGGAAGGGIEYRAPDLRIAAVPVPKLVGVEIEVAVIGYLAPRCGHGLGLTVVLLRGGPGIQPDIAGVTVACVEHVAPGVAAFCVGSAQRDVDIAPVPFLGVDQTQVDTMGMFVRNQVGLEVDVRFFVEELPLSVRQVQLVGCVPHLLFFALNGTRGQMIRCLVVVLGVNQSELTVQAQPASVGHIAAHE